MCVCVTPKVLNVIFNLQYSVQMAAQTDTNLSLESSRKNGWSLPLHLMQVCGWVAVLYFMFVYFSTMVPALPTHWQPAAYIVSFRCHTNSVCMLLCEECSVVCVCLCVCVCVWRERDRERECVCVYRVGHSFVKLSFLESYYFIFTL